MDTDKFFEDKFFEDKFFENKTFTERLEKNNRKATILPIMRELKEKHPEYSIETFICILDKIKGPSVFCIAYSGALYKRSVEIWNDHIFYNHKTLFSLLISYENISF